MRSQVLAAFISGAVSDDWPRPCFLFHFFHHGIHRARDPPCVLRIHAVARAIQLGAFCHVGRSCPVLADGGWCLLRHWMGPFERALIGSHGRLLGTGHPLAHLFSWSSRGRSVWWRGPEAGDPGPKEGTAYTFNSVELRAINVIMQPVGPLGGVPLETVAHEARPRRSAARAATEFVRNILFTARRQPAQPPEQLWEIPTGEESAILLRCC